MSRIWQFLTKPIFTVPAWVGPAVLTFVISGYIGYRGAVVATYRHEDSQQFSTLPATRARDLRRRVQILNEVELPVLFASVDAEQLRKQIERTEQLRNAAPSELLGLIDLQGATEELILASAEQRSKSAEAASHIASARKTLQSLGWIDVSDEALMAFAEHQTELKLRTARDK